MDEGSIFEQLLEKACSDLPAFAAMAAEVFPREANTCWRDVSAYRGSREFVYGVNAGLYLAARILRMVQEMEHNACAARHGWTIQEPTFTDADGVHPSVVVDNPTTHWFIAGSEEKCPGGP